MAACPDAPLGPPLRRKEGELLALLRQNPGRCFSRQELLQLVWGYDKDTKSRTLDVHIARLRHKLGAAGREHIRTVMHAGYYWSD